MMVRRMAAAARGVLLTGILAAGLAGCMPLPPETSIRAATPRPADVTPAPAQDRAEMTEGPGLPRLLGSYPSPDAAWRAEVIRYDCADAGEGQEMALDVLRLIRAEDGRESVAARQVQYCGGLGAIGLGGLFWSPEGRYFYYTTAREGSPDGGCRAWAPPVARVDVADLSTAELAEAVRSPDGSKVAGWRAASGEGAAGRELVVWDVDGAEVVRAATDPATSPVVSLIVWSPSGEALAYLGWENGCPPWGRTQLIRVNVPGGEPEVLLDSATAFTELTWEMADAITLRDEAGASFVVSRSGGVAPTP